MRASLRVPDSFAVHSSWHIYLPVQPALEDRSFLDTATLITSSIIFMTSLGPFSYWDYEEGSDIRTDGTLMDLSDSRRDPCLKDEQPRTMSWGSTSERLSTGAYGGLRRLFMMGAKTFGHKRKRDEL